MNLPNFNMPDLSRLLQPPALDSSVMDAINESNRRKSQALDSTNYLADVQRAGLASEVAKVVGDYIKAFDALLNDTQEVGIRLVSFGQSVVFHVHSLIPQDPFLIAFMGVNDDKRPVVLIQHVSQLSFMLMAVEKLDPDQPKRKFGFHPPEPPAR